MGWLKPLWIRLVLSLLFAVASAVVTFGWAVDSIGKKLARQFPNDGQVGLSAWVGGQEYALVAFVLAFGVVFILLRLLVPENHQK